MFCQDEKIAEEKQISEMPCHFLVLRDFHHKPTLDQLTRLLKLQFENLLFAIAKTKAHISCKITAQLISVFVFFAT